MMTIDEKPTLTINESMQLAWRHYQAGSRENARLISLRVLQVARKNPDALHLLGVLAYETNNHAMAIKLFTAALRTAKKYAPLHGNLALAKLAAGDLAGAAASARKAFALSPSYADAHRVLGIVHRHKGQLKEAIQEFERARALGLDTPYLETVLRETREQLSAQPAARPRSETSAPN